MPVFIFVYLCFFALVTALVLSACILLAMWLAFGRTNVVFRMPLFLLGTIPIGLIFGLVENGEVESALWVLVLLGMAIALLGQFHWALKTSLGVVLALSVLVTLAYPIDFAYFNLAWFSRVAIATSLAAACFMAFRFFFSFNLVRLVDDSNDVEMEKCTGKVLDAWLVKLRSAGADQWNHAQIMGYLRNYGVEFTWQKRITLAYRKTTGSYSVSKGFTGKDQVIEKESSDSESESNKRFGGFSIQQLGVKQLILLTFCVACLARFSEGISVHLPSGLELAIGFPSILALSVYVIGLLLSCLFVDRIHKRRLSIVLVCGVLSCFVFLICGSLINLSIGLYATLVFSLLLFMLSMVCIGILVQARYRTYRIVRVQ